MAVTSTSFQRSRPSAILVSLALCLTLLQTYQQEPKSRYEGLASYALGWALVYGLLRVIWRPSTGNTGERNRTFWLYWAIAATVAATVWSSGNMRWLWPLVTSLLVSLHRTFSRHSTADVSKEGLLTALISPNSKPDPSFPFVKVLEAVGISAFSLVAWVLLSDGLHFESLRACLALAFAWTVVFASLKIVSSPDDDSEERSNSQILLGTRLAWRTAVLLGGACVLHRMFLEPEPLHWTLAVRVLLIAGQWVLFFAIAQTASWEIATSILAFSTAGLDADYETLSYLAQGIACTLSLYQTTSFAPRSLRYRSALWIFLAVPLALFIQPLIYAYHPPVHMVPEGHHPIEALAYRADIQFNQMLQRQSQTLDAAVKEYKRRYRKAPPPGFQHWFEYAMEHNSPIIDDFDIIDQAIAPFWSMSGEEVVSMMRKVEEADGARLWGCKVQHGQWVEPCMENAMRSLLNSFQAHIPDVKLLFNGLDEPRLLSTAAVNDSEWWTETTHRNVWADLNGPCETNPSKVWKEQRLIDTQGIPFIQDTLDAIDICNHPEYEDLHGIWMAPSNWVVTPATVPILSPGRPSTMRDMVYPAAAYTQDRYMYDAAADMPFADKTPGLYWVGSTTGNFVSNDTKQEVWQQFHRQRFVRFANNLDRAEDEYDAYLLHNITTDTWEPVEKTDGLSTKHYYHVKFSKFVQCEPAACEAEEKYFKDAMTDWAPVEESLSYTLTMDLDGNGHSGRYYQLLGSRSLPLKQTVLKEWHDDRLFAWTHFVPISLGLEEVPEVVRFFVEEERGRKLAEELAEKGRLWHARALRPVDMAIYMYRLILEIARLQDPGRLGETL